MLLIYTNQLTPRLKYTFRFFFGKLLDIDYRVTDDIEEFNVSQYPRISYTQHPVEGIPFIQARNLLFEKGIIEQNIHVFDWENTLAFFATGKYSLLPFDPFAASFFLLSRYEEYLPHVKDKYGRFEGKESFAGRNGFLQFPIINIWAEKIAKVLTNLFPSIEYKTRPFTIVPTIDIDNAWAYLEKGLPRTIGAMGQDLYKADFNNLKQRIRTIVGLDKDIYDTYDFMKELHGRAKVKPVFFFLLADYGPLDRNVMPNNTELRKLIKSLADDYSVGIHPSFASNKDISILRKEIDRLSNILNKEITISRQHFLKLEFPQTYLNLLELDIREDYSLGFADLPGFRAGTSTPFYFFDLDSEQETPLLLHPVTVMDATLNNYLKLKPQEGLNTSLEFLQTVKKYGGQFMPLWHNETLSESFEWVGWKRVYQELIEQSMA